MDQDATPDNAMNIKSSDNEFKRCGRQLELENRMKEFGGKKVIDEQGFEFWEVDNPQKYLESVLMERKWVFHGTTGRYTELIPQKSQDEVKESGNRVAIYFTNCPILAEFCSLAGGGKTVGARQNSINMSYDTDTREVSDSEVKLSVEHPENVSDAGFVYLSPMEGTDFANGEWLAYEPRKPDIIVKVKKSDLSYPIEKIEK